MTSDRVSSAPAELFRALAVLAEPPVPGHDRVVRALVLGPAPDGAAYADVFLFQFHPYASVHLGPEGMLGGDARERVAGLWRAVGRTPPAEPDHLSALLALYAALLDEAADAPPAEATMALRSATALLHEHLAPWVPAYLERVAEATSGFYASWAALTAQALTQALASSPLESLPVHLQVAPGLPDPRVEGGAGFSAALLAPVRSGMIVTRGDLGALGRSLGLGLRLGERRFILEHLLAQDAPGVLGGLAEAAAGAQAGHAARRPVLGPVADFWAARAGATTTLLRALAREGAQALALVGEGPP